MQKVNIIGAGRVGRTLLRLLGDHAQDVAGSTRVSAERAVRKVGLGRACNLSEMRPADIWFLTVPDAQIARVADALADAGKPKAIAVHCSGFHKARVMRALDALGWALASAHPNLSFADPDLAAAAFKGAPVGVEGNPKAVAQVVSLFAMLGAEAFEISTENKALYHAGAVFSNNFATVLQAIAQDAWLDAGVPPELVPRLNAVLLAATAENVARLGPKAALTGPAARGDWEVVDLQERAVRAWRSEAGDLYRDLSRQASATKQKKA